MLYRMSLYQTAKEQQLSVGTLPVLSQYHLTGSFRLFQKEHPEISLALTEVEESELIEGIEKKRFVNNPVSVSLLSGDRKPQIRF